MGPIVALEMKVIEMLDGEIHLPHQLFMIEAKLIALNLGRESLGRRENLKLNQRIDHALVQMPLDVAAGDLLQSAEQRHVAQILEQDVTLAPDPYRASQARPRRAALR